MAIIHIVLFGWKSTATPEQVDNACKRMLALGQKCLHPTTNKPYVISLVGGKNNSPEGHAGASTHGFVVEFEKEDDREYYLNKDPEHLAFVKSVREIVEDIRVVDFEPGKF
ncbi:dabb-domain-containing protein [Trematosphaeria pertusa]|uniref:Dabb-domain-containing protein n=1 Tax=Trematosphaeria pertusa TaxID=390896 RepID=A0A6A6J2H4_9PLEO|nr:dabb-domain-containing protein [Trematosphaeria pertusa]KAF2257034.1 dabb-domain-containing protein [Trematosphaeria pertusa]